MYTKFDIQTNTQKNKENIFFQKGGEVEKPPPPGQFYKMEKKRFG